MEVTGQTKIEFEKWLKETPHQINIWHCQWDGNDLEFISRLQSSAQYGIFVDFFDSVEIQLDSSANSFGHDFSVFITYRDNEGIFKALTPAEGKTRHEAQEAAITKVNEFFNSTKTK